MSVKDIIKLVAIYLQQEDILELSEMGGEVTEPTDLTEKNLELLTRCLNLVYDEVATDYLPLKTVEELTVTDGVIELDTLTKRLINVIRLTDVNDCSVRYKLYPTSIETSTGNVNLEYSYMPDSVTIDDDIESFSGKLTKRIIAYGVASEYCLISGLYDEASLWEKRFKDALLIASRKKSDVTVKARRWF